MSNSHSRCIVRHSQTRDWRCVVDFVHDAIADAMHDRAVREGFTPQFTLRLSRRLLLTSELTELALVQRARNLSTQLARYRVRHAIDMVVRGDSEPTRHELRIFFSQS